MEKNYVVNEESNLVDSNPVEVKKKNFKDKIKNAKNNITVEPCVLLFIVPNVICYYTLQNLYLDRACRVNLAFNETICDALRSRETFAYHDEEVDVEQLHTQISALKNLVQTAIPCMLIFFVGGWSDRTGYRKPLLLFPVLGDLIGFIGYLGFSTVLSTSRLEYLAVFEAAVSGIGGNWIIYLMGVYSYIADVTSKEQRTVRVGATNMCISFAVPLGTALSGVLLKWTGFAYVFLICMVMNIFAMLYTCFVLPESPVREQIRRSKVKTKNNFMSMDHVKDTFLIFTGSKNTSLRIVLVLFVVCVVYGPWQGEMTILLLYTRLKLNWNEFWFSMFNTYAMVVNFCGNLIAMSYLSRKLKFDDASIGFISSGSKIMAAFVYAFASESWHMIFAPLLDLFNGSAYIALRAIASKLVPSEELGKLYSMFGFVEAMMPMVFAPIYLKVYQETLDIFPGAVYFLGASLSLLAVGVFIWFYYEHKKDHKRATADKEMKEIPEN